MNKELIPNFLDGLDSEHTQRAYRTDLNKFYGYVEEDISKMDIEAVSTGDIRAFLAKMRNDGLSYATRRRRLAAIRRLYDWLVREHNISDNPARSADLQLQDTGEDDASPQFLEKEELEGLVQTAGTDPKTGPRDQALILVILYGALRRSEVAALNIEHVRPLGRNWVIDVPSSSDGRGGFVKIPDLAATAVQRLVETYDYEQGPLWRSYSNRSQGQRMSAGALYKRVRAIGRDADLGPIDMETLRRSGLRLASKSGASPAQVQAHARLQDSTSVVRYFDPASEQARLSSTAADVVDLQIEL